MDSDKIIFFSYSRDDSEFVLNLAKNLRKAGATIWLDQLDISPGMRWDSSIEKALSSSKTLLVVLSVSSVKSNNVMDEVSYALEEHKNVVPVLLEACDIPFRLRRLQYADFSGDYKVGIATLIKALNLENNIAVKLVDVSTENPAETKQIKQIIDAEERKNIEPEIIPEVQNNHDTKTKTVITDSDETKPDKKRKNLLYGSILVGLVTIIALASFFFNTSNNSQENEIESGAAATDSILNEHEYDIDAIATFEEDAENIEANTKTIDVVEEKKPISSTKKIEEGKQTISKNNETTGLVTAENVRRVNYVGGCFEQISATKWVELSSENNSKFTFTELNRDEFSVYLIDNERDLTIKIDLHQKQIYLDFENADGGSLLYYITASIK